MKSETSAQSSSAPTATQLDLQFTPQAQPSPTTPHRPMAEEVPFRKKFEKNRDGSLIHEDED